MTANVEYSSRYADKLMEQTRSGVKCAKHDEDIRSKGGRLSVGIWRPT